MATPWFKGTWIVNGKTPNGTTTPMEVRIKAHAMRRHMEYASEWPDACMATKAIIATIANSVITTVYLFRKLLNIPPVLNSSCTLLR